MKKGILVNLLCVILLCVGCTAIRQTAVDISIEEIKNTETARVIARNHLSIWHLQSGFIKGALGPRLDELPQQAVDAIEELNQLAVQYNSDPNSYSDYDLGLSLGLKVRLLTSVIAEALKMYAPDVLELVPFLL